MANVIDLLVTGSFQLPRSSDVVLTEGAMWYTGSLNQIQYYDGTSIITL